MLVPGTIDDQKACLKHRQSDSFAAFTQEQEKSKLFQRLKRELSLTYNHIFLEKKEENLELFLDGTRVARRSEKIPLLSTKVQHIYKEERR